MRLSFLLPALAAFQASARIFSLPSGEDISSGALGSDGLNNPDIVSSPSLLPSFQHEKRETRPKCAPPVYTGADKRDFFLDVRNLNVTLDRRLMTLPPGTQAKDMNDWMIDEMNNELFESIIWTKKVNGEVQDMATAVFEEFGDTALSLGTGFLCGCTTLVIVSRKAVYMGHYWESISFNPDKEWIEKFKTPDACFQQTVIKGLTTGIGRGNPEQVTSEGDENGYRPQWDALKAKVNEFVPRLATGDRWTEVKYDALNNKDRRLKTTARGRILMKYDPDHYGKKKAALWIEQNATPYDDDEW